MANVSPCNDFGSSNDDLVPFVTTVTALPNGDLARASIDRLQRHSVLVAVLRRQHRVDGHEESTGIHTQPILSNNSTVVNTACHHVLMSNTHIAKRQRLKAYKLRLLERWIFRNLDNTVVRYNNPSRKYTFYQSTLTAVLTLLTLVTLQYAVFPEAKGDVYALGEAVFTLALPFLIFTTAFVFVLGKVLVGVSNREFFGLDIIATEGAKRKIVLIYAISIGLGATLTYGAGERWKELWVAYKSENSFAGSIESFFVTNPVLQQTIQLTSLALLFILLDRVAIKIVNLLWSLSFSSRRRRIESYHCARLSNPIPDSSLTVGAVLWLTPRASLSRGVYAVVQSDQSLLLPSGAIRPADELSLYFNLVRLLSPEVYPSTEPGTLGLPKYGNSTIPLLLSSSGWRKPGSSELITPGPLRHFTPPIDAVLMPSS